MENNSINISNIEQYVNKDVVVNGWIKTIRKHSQVYFIDLYDAKSSVQCVLPDSIQDKMVRGSCVSMSGTVVNREKDQINNDICNGTVEIHVKEYTIFSVPKVFLSENATEDIHLQHRPIYLHDRKLRKLIDMRSDFLQHLRNWAIGESFQEIQTPILTAATMEGARDFIIPSRLHRGKFYALPQAPQMFKQLLMIGGIEKYFQIAPCFRDEDSRNDRCYGEFYQLDMEMSFCNMNDILNVIESFVKSVSEFGKRDFSFSIMDYKDAINIYGSDKPDLRFPLKMEDFTDFFSKSSFDLFRQKINEGAIVKAIRHINCKNPNKVLAETEKLGFKIAYINRKNGKIAGPIAKFCEDVILKEDETIFFICHKNPCELGGKLINILKNDYEDYHDKLNFLFIKNMKMFEKDKNNKWTFTHNPFSKPQNPDAENIEDIIGFQYDLVCNGYELASGGLRNENYDCLLKMFNIAGYNEEQVLSHFAIGKALRDYAAPPHGGFAIGIDRLLMILSNATSIRNMSAFPMNSNGVCHLMNAPNTVTQEQLNELHIKLNKY